ncbi:MAG: hypothetical protein RSF13_07045 [Clostridiales bacterium]
MLAVIVQLAAWLIGGVELRRLLPLTHVVQNISFGKPLKKNRAYS